MAIAACSSTGGGGPSAVGPMVDGGVTPRPGEMCQKAVTCGTTKTYQQCVAGSGTSCQSRYVTGDGQSFDCASCMDCQMAATQVGKWCNGMSTGGSDGGTATGPDSMCATLSVMQCASCCDTNHPAGQMTFAQLLSNCECVMPGDCVFECANSYCNGSQPGNRCTNCILGNTVMGGVCDVTPDCSGDPDCKSWLDCANACPSM
jgi:hypothetical protein